jgi:hypothetical protein
VIALAGLVALPSRAGAAPATSAAPSTPSQTSGDWAGKDRTWLPQPRLATPEDRYALAGGCYAIQAAGGRYVARRGKSFAARSDGLAGAEPFHFQATDLGQYLLFGSQEDFLAVTEGYAEFAAYRATHSTPGAIAGGVAMEQTDKAADEIARSPANVGRGQSVIQSQTPSNRADWVIDEVDGGFTLVLPETDQAIAAQPDGTLALVASDAGTPFNFELTKGCATFPEIEVNVDGPVLGGETTFQETRGFLEAHLHAMAFEFLGGRARCGRPWHRFGVMYALVDCPDHEPGGQGAVLESLLSDGTPFSQHDVHGWPTFAGWPRYGSYTHEQVYYKWLERAWRGGMRLVTNLLVDNNQLCKIYPYKRNSCNEMDGVRLQAKRIRELERYIDAQSGGPGEGWFRIVTDPFQAREVINEGRLAIILGVEVSVPFDCGITLEVKRCSEELIDSGLDEVYDLGVRQMELVNKFDNGLSGVAGDGGTTGIIVNQGNKGETGQYWQMDTCDESEGDATDKTQLNFHDSGAPDQITGRDSLAGGVFSLFGTTGVLPIYPEGPHCNVRDLTDLGRYAIRGLMKRGMIFDPDHMSARAQTEAMDLVASTGYSGVVSSHGWSNTTIYPKIYKAGGVVTPHAGESESFVNKWMQHKGWADPRYYWGFGIGSDMNGFSAQGGPRDSASENPLQYPFTGFGGTTIHQQHSGSRVYDLNVDGVAHYGLYPDWIEDLRVQAGDAIVDDMERGPEAYLQMWERAIGIAPDACRTDVADLTDARLAGLQQGMTPRAVLETLGQPHTRVAATFTYCLEGNRTATLTFTQDGHLSSWQ